MLERVYGFRAIFVSARTIKRHHHQEELWEAARDEEMKIPWRAASEGPPVPEEQYRCYQHTPVVSMLLAHTSSHSPVLLWRCSAYNGPASILTTTQRCHVRMRMSGCRLLTWGCSPRVVGRGLLAAGCSPGVCLLIPGVVCVSLPLRCKY